MSSPRSRRPRLRRFASPFAVACFACGCGDTAPDVAAPQVPTAVVRLQEAPIRLADRARIDVHVQTPPGHHVNPPQLPKRVPGFDRIEWREVAIDREARRWVHRYRILLRALETGDFEWPASELEVAAPDASLARISLPTLQLAVASIRPEHPGRTAPFGARPAPPTQASLRPSPLALSMGAVALGLIALLAVARARPSRPLEARPAQAPDAAPWANALAEMEAAAVPDADPIAAGHSCACALRDYMRVRYDADTLHRTTEELAAATPPFGARSNWPGFVECLRDFDAIRFRRASERDRGARMQALSAAATRARAFVAATTPPQASP